MQKATEFEVGDMLVARSPGGYGQDGMRRCMVVEKGKLDIQTGRTTFELWAEPCIPNDGMDPMPLQRWIDSTIAGVELANKPREGG